MYELPDMVLLDKKSLKLEGVQDFAWSPSQPILCAYQTEQAGGNLPARISLISFPEKRELRQKNLFSVSGARLRRSRPLSVRVCMDCVMKVDSGHALHAVKNGQFKSCIKRRASIMFSMQGCPSVTLQRIWIRPNRTGF